ncbi:unnamed protein product [Rhizophagus irregularis]|nr:unnamed protein product [Rhizophagus irregularis]
MNHLGHFYLCVSVLLDIIDNQDDVRGKVISLDPGVMTGYDPDGQLIKWGNGDIDKVFKLSKKMNVITRLARWLCQNYEIILLPKFETSHMVLKNKRKIQSRTARAMLTWSHFRFRMFLCTIVPKWM